MATVFGEIVNALLFVMGIIIFCGFFHKIFRDRFGGERSVPAIVSGKNSFTRRAVFKSQAPYSEKMYVVVFDVGGRDESFFVSEQTYNSVNAGDRGLLVFKGTKFLDFAHKK